MDGDLEPAGSAEPAEPGEPPEPGEPMSLEMVTAALRADSGDVTSLARVFTATIGETLPPGMVEVERERGLADRLAGREGAAVAVRISFPERALELRRGRTGLHAEVRQVVRGVVISRRELPVEEWIQTLAAELTSLAARDAAARAALAALLGTT